MSEALVPPDFVSIFAVRIWNPNFEEFQVWFEQSLHSERPALLGIANAHTMNLVYERPAYKAALQSMDALVNDGVGMRMASRMRGRPFRENLNGTDLVPRLFAESRVPVRVFLYGATEASNAGAAAAIAERYPKVEVVGRMNGFDHSAEEVVDEIASRAPQLLLVALGQPRQELFLVEHRERLRCGVACGVGALFDFLSGNVKRAPVVFRKAKMEWLYRLALEPRRMFGRYVTGNPKFLLRARAWRTRDMASLD